MKATKATKKFTAAKAKVDAPVGLEETGAAYFDSLAAAAETIQRAHPGARRHTEKVEHALAAEKEAHTATAAAATEALDAASLDYQEKITVTEREHGAEVAGLNDKIKNLEAALLAERTRFNLIQRTING